jgi:KaiC/GvpD/RAD55 family RecA-like ATPase
MSSNDRISTGIPGLDELMQGGFVKNSVNLVTGETGTGKSIFGLQYIWEGLQKGENGVYISLEQEPDNIFADVKAFGWDFQPYIEKGKCIIEHLPSWKLEELPVMVSEKINSIKAKRFVLDSLTLVCSSLDLADIRSEMTEFVKGLRHLDATNILLSEIPEESKSLSRFGIEEFIADGIIVLHYLEFVVGGSPRSLIIRKMRRTSHGTDVYPIKITNKGLAIIRK